jgi:6-pyruvoyltetrahydropterin/6-carboxytetrahydropterin synthase
VPETSLFEVNVEAIFPAAHALRNYYGKTEPIHGHNWKMRVTIEGPRLDSMGLLIDFIGLKKSIARVLSRLDHTFLNEVPPFDVINPSAENVARFIHDDLNADLPALQPETPVRISRVEVWEMDQCSAVYRP